MKTFKQFISEAAEPQQLDDFLQKHCKDFMHEINADLAKLKDPKFSLYRGIRLTNVKDIILTDDGDEIEGYIKKVRSERRPLDTSSAISKLVDDVLEEKFGWRPRSQAIFCFTYRNRGGTTNFGLKSRVFPMGKMQYVYSPTVRDMTLQLSNWLDAQGLKYVGKGKQLSADELEAYKFGVKSFIEQNDYTDKGLEDAMMDNIRPEVMVKCNEYLAVGVSLHESQS